MYALNKDLVIFSAGFQYNREYFRIFTCFKGSGKQEAKNITMHFTFRSY